MALVAGGGGFKSPVKKPVQKPSVTRVPSTFTPQQARRTATVSRQSTYTPPRTSYSAPVTKPAAKPAPKPAAKPAPKPAAKPAPKPVVQENQYPWLDAQFNKYFNAIQQDFADRGLLDSTNKKQPMTELADAMSQRWAQEARTDNQQAIQNALTLWDKLTSANLARQGNELAAGMDYEYEDVAQPSIFSDIFKNVYLPPTKSSGGPIGDAPVEERRPTMTRGLGVDTARGRVIPSTTWSAPNYAYRDTQANIASQLELQRQQEARLAQQAAQENAIANAYLKLAQEQAPGGTAGSEGGTNDVWAAMAQDVMTNRMQAQDEVQGNERHPTDLFTWFAAAYPEVDLEAEIRANNPRAIALVSSAYSDPEVASAVINRVKAGGTWKKQPEQMVPRTKAAVDHEQKVYPRFSVAADIPSWKSQYTTPYSEGLMKPVKDVEDLTDRLMPTTLLYRLGDWAFNPKRPKF